MHNCIFFLGTHCTKNDYFREIQGFPRIFNSKASNYCGRQISLLYSGWPPDNSNKIVTYQNPINTSKFKALDKKRGNNFVIFPVATRRYLARMATSASTSTSTSTPTLQEGGNGKNYMYRQHDMTCTTYTLDFVVLTFEVPGGHVDILANLGQITLKLREFKQNNSNYKTTYSCTHQNPCNLNSGGKGEPV